MLLKTKQFWFVRYRCRNKLLFSSAHLFLVEDSYKAQSRVLDVCGFRLVKPTESWRHHKIYTHSSKGPGRQERPNLSGRGRRCFSGQLWKEFRYYTQPMGGTSSLSPPSGSTLTCRLCYADNIFQLMHQQRNSIENDANVDLLKRLRTTNPFPFLCFAPFVVEELKEVSNYLVVGATQTKANWTDLLQAYY